MKTALSFPAMHPALKKMLGKKSVRKAVFVIYFLAAFLVFLFYLFPYDAIKTRLESEVRRRTPFELKITNISPGFLNRFTLHDVVLADQSGKVLFESPRVQTRVSLLGLLRGMLSVHLKGAAYGGEVIAKAQQGPGRQLFMIDADALDISAYPLLARSGVRVTGKLGGTFEMNGDIGKGRVWFKALAWRGLKITGMPIPDQDFEQGWIEADVKADRLSIRKLDLEGKELKVKATGDIILRQQGTLNLQVKLRPSERLTREYQGLLAALKNRDADGFYSFAIGGTVSSPMPRL